jgi:two-component system, chemotaxis family, protein-glutamate methylesterase/glutaminase
MTLPRRTKLLIIDYMALVRKVLTKGFAFSSTIDVVGAVSTTPLAARKILSAQPDVIVFDVQPPVAQEVRVLQELLADFPIPLVLLTGLDDADRLAVMGALHIPRPYVIAKPRSGLVKGLEARLDDIAAVVRQAHHHDVLAWQQKRQLPMVVPRPLVAAPERIIAIGASTGGTEAICQVLSPLPPETPGIVIVQHMPGGFTRKFAERLNDLAAMEVKEAEDGDRVYPGRVLLAPGGYQMRIACQAQGYMVRVARGAKVSGHCPSVDVLMHSVAQQAGPRSIGILLTGMGSDGAEGMKAMRQAGAITLAQDEHTSVVFGMPKEAYKRGGVEKLVPLYDMARQLLASLHG